MKQSFVLGRILSLPLFRYSMAATALTRAEEHLRKLSKCSDVTDNVIEDWDIKINTAQAK
jgi:hypothetical protein